MKAQENTRVDHNYEELEEGKTYVLIPKDTSLIDYSRGEINEEITELENPELQARYKEKLKREQKEWAERIPGQSTGLLPQYETNELKKQGMTLNESGSFDPSHSNQQIANNKRENSINDHSISLDTQKRFVSEYEVPDPPKIRRPKFVSKRKKAEQTIADFLAEEAPQEERREPQQAARKRREEETEAKETQEQLLRDQKFQRAVKKAKLQELAEKEEYDEIEAAINRHVLTRKAAPESKPDILEVLSKQESIPDTGPGVQIVDTLSFITTVPTAREIKDQRKAAQNSSLSLKDSKDGKTSVVNVTLPTERLRITKPGFSSCVPENFKIPTFEPTQPVFQSSEPMQINSNAVLDELLIGKGVGNVMKILRERKLLGQTFHRGRYKDKTQEEIMQKYHDVGKTAGENVGIEYRDETGYKMTLKEAFRYHSRIYHGKRQAKGKREKELLKREKNKQKLNSDQVKDSKLFQALSKVQQEKKTPYMVLDEKRKVML